MADYIYTVEKKLIIVPVTLSGKTKRLESEFILDTGSSLIIIDHGLISALGYSAHEGVGVSTVASAVGKERGYRLVIQGLETLGKQFSQLEVAAHDLKEQGVEGLIGMSILEQFKWCIDPQRKIISI